MRHVRLLAAALLAGMLLCEPALAVHPFATDDAGTVGAKAMELELAALGAWSGEGDAWHFDQVLAAHWGALPFLDLGVAAGYEWHLGHDHETDELHYGALEPSLDLKLQLVDPTDAGFGLALRFDYGSPRRVGSASAGHEVGGVAILSVEGSRLNTHLNAGVGPFVMPGEDETNTVYLAAAMLAAANEQISMGFELVAEDVTNGHLGALSLQGALVWCTGNTTWSLGAGPSWSPGEPIGAFFSLGATGAFAPSAD